MMAYDKANKPVSSDEHMNAMLRLYFSKLRYDHFLLCEVIVAEVRFRKRTIFTFLNETIFLTKKIGQIGR